jgi:hypothetical protein
MKQMGTMKAGGEKNRPPGQNIHPSNSKINLNARWKLFTVAFEIRGLFIYENFGVNVL